MFGNDWGSPSRVLGAVAPLGDSVLYISRDFWFEAVLGAGFGGLAVLGGAWGWCPSAWSLMRGRGAAAIWGFPARNF